MTELQPRCTVCNKPLSPGDFCDDLQCPNPGATRDAAEGARVPFAWVVLSDQTGNTRMWTRNGDIAKAFAAKHLLECVELYAVRRDREAIARAIFKSRLRVGDQTADIYFARRASHPQAIDDSTMAVDAAFRDADAILSLPVQPGAGERERFKHVKRGTIYLKIGEAQVQAPEDAPLTDYELVTVYLREGSEPPEYWVRRNSEFNDGRFARQAPHSSREGGR